MRNWLSGLWRLSGPTGCEPEKQGAGGAVPCPRAQDRRLSSSRRAEEGCIPPSSAFGCGRALRGLDDAHPHWEGRARHRVPGQTLTSPGNAATGTRCSPRAVMLTHSIGHPGRTLPPRPLRARALPQTLLPNFLRSPHQALVQGF